MFWMESDARFARSGIDLRYAGLAASVDWKPCSLGLADVITRGGL
jgi:hypothetical protein